MSLKELIAPKEITRDELSDLVKEFLAEGQEITQCTAGVALNFRTSETPKVSIPKKIRKIRKSKK